MLYCLVIHWKSMTNQIYKRATLLVDDTIRPSYTVITFLAYDSKDKIS